jgi:MFS family permease
MSISTRNIKLYFITQFLYALVFTIPIWIAYYQGRVSVSQISFLVAFQYAVQLFLEMPTGALADLLGRKYCVAAGYGLWAISFIIVIFTGGFVPLVIASLLGGLAESLISGSLEALLYDTLKQDHQEAQFSQISAKNSLYFQVALAIATFSGGFLYSLHWSLPYAACAIAHVIAFVLALGFIEPKSDSKKFTFGNYIAQIKEGFLHAFATKEVALMSTFYVFVSAITWSNNIYFFDFILVDLQFTSVQRSIIGAVVRLLNVFVLGTLLKNEHLFTRSRSIFFFPVVMSLCFLPGIFFNGAWALPLIAGTVMAGTARWIVLTRYTNELFESKYRATAISVLSMLVGVLFVAITLISGPIIELFGSVKIMYTLLGIATLISVLPLSILVNKQRPPR